MNKFSTLEKAFKEIALDNGMINRYTFAPDVIREMFDRVTAAFTVDQMISVEEELSKLSEDELQSVCCDSPDDVDRPIETDGLADQMLNEAFGG